MGTGSIQGVGWKVDHALRSHKYVIPEGAYLKYAATFAYADSPKGIAMEREGD